MRERTQSLWYWVKREGGKAYRVRDHLLHQRPARRSLPQQARLDGGRYQRTRR